MFHQCMNKIESREMPYSYTILLSWTNKVISLLRIKTEKFGERLSYLRNETHKLKLGMNKMAESRSWADQRENERMSGAEEVAINLVPSASLDLSGLELCNYDPG